MKCDCAGCVEEARFNFQLDWIKYSIAPNGEYVKHMWHLNDYQPEDSDNIHLCENHAEMWEETGGGYY